MARKSILVIANRMAGSAKGARLDSMIDGLERHGCSVTLEETTARGDAETLAARADGERYDAIAAAGGDGTINEVLNGLPKAGPPLAILPLGTANVLAKEIGLPRSIDGIVETLVFGPSRSISVGEVNGRRFAVMASVGLDAVVVENVDLRMKRHVGKLAYLYETAKQIIHSAPCSFDLRIGGTKRRAQGVVIANGRHYAGRYVAAPAAHLEKPCLDVCHLTRTGRLAAPLCMIAMMLGRLAASKDYQIVEATDLEILGPIGAPLQADGDVLCRLPATIRVLPAAVDLVFPPKA